MDHPTFAQLTAFDQGRLPRHEARLMERHIAACDLCCDRLEEVPDDEVILLLRACVAGAKVTQAEYDTGPSARSSKRHSGSD